MVLANEERDCAAHLSHPMNDPRTGRMINPRPAFGMWAIETYPQKWRGPMCTNGAVRDVQTQVNCAVHTMADIHIRKRGLSAYDPLSYWGPVRRYQKQILPNMRLHKPCYQ
jgi:hypothetical protein